MISKTSIGLFLPLIVGLAASSVAIAQTNLAPVEVTIAWENKDLDTKMQIFEPKSRNAKIWEMGTVKDPAKLPISREFEGSTLSLARGAKKTFVLVMKNETDQPKFFFAAPHVATPAEFSLGFKFKCLCINHAFKIPPKETWYRVVNLDLSKGFVGDKIEIKHTLVGITEERMKAFKMPLGGSAHNH